MLHVYRVSLCQNQLVLLTRTNCSLCASCCFIPKNQLASSLYEATGLCYLGYNYISIRLANQSIRTDPYPFLFRLLLHMRRQVVARVINVDEGPVDYRDGFQHVLQALTVPRRGWSAGVVHSHKEKEGGMEGRKVGERAPGRGYPSTTCSRPARCRPRR